MFGNKKGLEHKLSEHGGVAAWATIISAETLWTSQSHTNSADMYAAGSTHHMKVRLKVEPERDLAFEATFKQAFPNEIAHNGWRAKVIYDPNDHSKIAIQEDQIFPPTEPNAAGPTGALTPAEQISAMRQQLGDKSARGTLDGDGYKAALLRLSNLEQLLAEGEISDYQLTELLKVDAGVAATSMFPTADGLKQVVLKADGAITLSGAGSGSTMHASTSAADEIAKLAELKTKGLLTDAEFAAGKEKLLGI